MLIEHRRKVPLAYKFKSQIDETFEEKFQRKVGMGLYQTKHTLIQDDIVFLGR